MKILGTVHYRWSFPLSKVASKVYPLLQGLGVGVVVKECTGVNNLHWVLDKTIGAGNGSP